jgi:hypothetical protein
VNEHCESFRDALAEALSASDPDRRGIPKELGWHEHVLTCPACREILDAEEALDQLLDTLPEPHLPDDLAQRVLARLARGDDDRLEALLELEAAPEVPRGLPERVLARLEPERVLARPGTDDPLDVLLGRLPDPKAPTGLATRVLSALDGERRSTLRPMGRPVREMDTPARWPRRVALLAAALLIAVFVTLWSKRSPSAVDPMRAGGADSPGPIAAKLQPDVDELEAEEVDPELLAALDLLENWETLTSDDLDLFLDDLDAVEVALLEYVPDDQEGG